MRYDRRSVLELTSIRAQPESNGNYRQHEEYRGRKKPRSCTCYSGPAVAGLILGVLVSGIAFAALLTLYLRTEDSKITCATMITTVPSSTTTASTTTTTTVTGTTTSSTTSTTTIAALNVNLVVNGDAETGPCSSNAVIVSPTGWSFSGPITQSFYNNTGLSGQAYSSPGPSNRGQCYFVGGISASTSMWQTIDLTNKINPVLIDSQTIGYNLSAWLGGLTNQDDNTVISLTFMNSNNQLVGNCSSIGPVLANDRGNITSLIYQETDGFLPVGTRSMILCVTLTRVFGQNNNANTDNIALILY